jgi:hypothetical protein
MARDDAQFRVRLPDKLRAEIVEQAEKSGRSINAEIVARLENSLGWDQFDPAQLSVDIEEIRDELKEVWREIRALNRQDKRDPNSWKDG